MKHRLPIFAAALWWGSLSAIGFMAVPMLFANLPQMSMAGFMAAKLFAAQTWVSVVCTLLLLLVGKDKQANALYPWARAALGFIIGGMLLALLVQYGVSPRIVARQHSLGTVMYALQWLCAGMVLWRVSAQPSAQA